MHRLISLILVAAVSSAASVALAQADAQQAYEEAKTAYQAGDFTTARDLAQKASQTDNQNAEVFLLLGKAHFQLGELDEALAAWKQTLKLAPEEPFAKRMLQTLRSETTDVETRIKLVEVMIQQRLFAAALAECRQLLVEKAITEAQRARVLTYQANSLIRSGKYAEAHRLLRRLLTLYGEQADSVQTALLLGQAKLRGDDRAVAEALTILRKVLAEHPDTPAAALAQYELIAFDLRLGVTPARAEAMAQWLAANGNHELADQGRRTLLGAYLKLTLQGTSPGSESELSPTDVQALALAAEIYAQDSPLGKADELTKQLVDHLQSRYVATKAYTAAVKAAETLLAAPLTQSSRLPVLKMLGLSKYQLAIKWLSEQARAGKLPQGVARGQLPQPLAEVLATYATVRQEYPNEPLWADQAELAKQVRAQSGNVLPVAEFPGLKGPDAWSLDVALPVIKADADASAVTSAVETVLGIIQECEKLNKPGSRMLAVQLSTELLQAISVDHPSWPKAITSYYTVAQNYAPYAFQENIKAGRAEENEKLSDVQKAYLKTLSDHLLLQAKQAPHALVQLAEHVKPWVEHGHWTVAEEVYAAVVDALPEKERRQADLAVVNLWVQQVIREHQRLVQAGLTVPRALDPTLAKALVRCYQLQAGLDEEPAILEQVRGVWNSVVDHYASLEYYDVAEAAVLVKAEEAVAAADEYAAFQLVSRKDEQARRELTRFLQQYSASEKITLGPSFEAVIAAWSKFIADHPTSPLVPQTIEKIFGIGQLFEQQGAHEIAAGVYRDFAGFAAGVAVLSQSAPGTSSTAERAAFAVAAALDARARKALAKLTADRKGYEPPPAKLSEEFSAAIAAYKGFIAAHPDSALVGDATGKVMAVAFEYAKIDAWDVADSVYTDLLASELAIRRPERLKFCRGLCQLGRAMPDHAREVLGALTGGGLRGSDEAIDPAMLAGVLAGRGGVGGGGAGGLASANLPTEQPAPAKPPAAAPSSDAAATPAPADAGANRDLQLLAMIRRQESSRAAQIARLREPLAMNQTVQPQAQQGEQSQRTAAVAVVLSDAELARQETALAAAYDIFQGIRKEHPHTLTAEQVRAEILVMVGHWRTLSQWERAAELALRFLADNPADRELPKLRLEVGRDRLAWASKAIEGKAGKQAMLAEVSRRHDAARSELARIVADFPNERNTQQQAQWEIANSFLAQARVVAAFSPTLARGQYVRATKELRQVAQQYPDHPQIGKIPETLWNISTELENRGYHEEAILVWNELTIHDPMHQLSQQAALKIAQTYHQKLKRPLRAAEAYQELNFARAGTDQNLQNAIFQIGSELKDQKRWVEALHVMESFVDSFPAHEQAGQALTTVGQIHQTNEAWEDAIAAYRRVIAEFKNGQWSQDAKWAIAECTINLSQWREATAAYRAYVAAYPEDAKVAEANRRIEVLKDLQRYQGLVDEEGQRKAFDAQHQIAVIVGAQLANPVKAIIEHRKVVVTWPESHLADDALYAIGTTYLSLGETEKAREALLNVAEKYPASPLADDALFMVGKSYEDEAGKLATATRETTIEQAKDVAQRNAYQEAQSSRRAQRQSRSDRIASLKKAGKGKVAEQEEASTAANYAQFNEANVKLFAQKAGQEVEVLTASQLADRQDKINAALRKAVDAYTATSKVAGADKADEALLQMATIYDERLKDSQAAMQTWLEIVRQFSGTAVAENASWRIAQYYEREGEYSEAIEAFQAFLRNYRRSPKAGEAQFAVAENHERLDQWVNAMDAYTNYITNFPEGPLVAKAKEQINWIKTYRL